MHVCIYVCSTAYVNVRTQLGAVGGVWVSTAQLNKNSLETIVSVGLLHRDSLSNAYRLNSFMKCPSLIQNKDPREFRLMRL